MSASQAPEEAETTEWDPEFDALLTRLDSDTVLPTIERANFAATAASSAHVVPAPSWTMRTRDIYKSVHSATPLSTVFSNLPDCTRSRFVGRVLKESTIQQKRKANILLIFGHPLIRLNCMHSVIRGPAEINIQTHFKQVSSTTESRTRWEDRSIYKSRSIESFAYLGTSISQEALAIVLAIEIACSQTAICFPLAQNPPAGRTLSQEKKKLALNKIQPNVGRSRLDTLLARNPTLTMPGLILVAQLSLVLATFPQCLLPGTDPVLYAATFPFLSADALVLTSEKEFFESLMDYEKLAKRTALNSALRCLALPHTAVNAMLQAGFKKPTLCEVLEMISSVEV